MEDKDKKGIHELSISKRLEAGEILIADGATGTMLIAAGLPQDTPTELWNVENPEQIIKLHCSYIDAGSQIILTNTFSSNKVRLERLGYADRASEFNKAGAQLAKKAAGDRAYVAGDIGPTAELLEPFGSLSFDLAVESFAEQAAALVSGGVDALWVETMTDIEEVKAAITGIKQVTNLPVLCSMSFGKNGYTMMGNTPSQAAEVVIELGVTAFGINCGEGLENLDEIFAQIKSISPKLPIIAKPNAGLPKVEDGKIMYDVNPEEFAKWIKHFTEGGAQIVGGCCGSNTSFIAAIKDALGR